MRRLPNEFEGLIPNQGLSPENNDYSSAGHSHRRTTGGIAEADEAMTFGSKPIRYEAGEESSLYLAGFVDPLKPNQNLFAGFGEAPPSLALESR